MNHTERLKILRVLLVVVGLVFIFGVWTLGQVWPSGWSWHEGGRSVYMEMILGVYATLGVFLLIASRDPLAHRSLIWFTVWSSVVHGAVMGIQAIIEPSKHAGHLIGDVPGLILVAAAIGFLMPRSAQAAR